MFLDSFSAKKFLKIEQFEVLYTGNKSEQKHFLNMAYERLQSIIGYGFAALTEERNF